MARSKDSFREAAVFYCLCDTVFPSAKGSIMQNGLQSSLRGLDHDQVLETDGARRGAQVCLTAQSSSSSLQLIPEQAGKLETACDVAAFHLFLQVSPIPPSTLHFPVTTRATLSAGIVFAKCLLSCTPRRSSSDGLL